MKYIALIGFLLHYLTGYSQYTSQLGRFQVDEIKGCAPFVLNVTDFNLVTTGECTTAKPCLIDFTGNGTEEQNATTFTYAEPGTYTLSILYQSIGADIITITVEENVATPFKLSSCGGNQVQISVDPGPYEKYVLAFDDGSPEDTISLTSLKTTHTFASPGTYIISVRGKLDQAKDNCTVTNQTYTAVNALPIPAVTSLTAVDNTLNLQFQPEANQEFKVEMSIDSDNNFQPTQTLYGVDSYTTSSLPIDEHYYCFRLSAFDPCSGADQFASIICSQQISAEALTGENQLDWKTSSTGIDFITIVRDGQLLSQVPPSRRTYTDTSVVCNQTYCYNIVSHYSNGSSSTSLAPCVQSFSSAKPAAIDHISIAITNKTASLSWIYDDAYSPETFEVYRAIFDASYRLIGRVTIPQIEDVNYKIGRPTCYQVSYTDECGNESDPGIIACPTNLYATLESDLKVNLSWTAYQGWADGVANYTIEKYDPQGTLIESINAGIGTSYTEAPDYENQVVEYRVVVNPIRNSVTVAVSNSVTIHKESSIATPNAFTPDNNQVNDTFSIFGTFIDHLDLVIFDQWGAPVYFSDDLTPWNGMKGGKPMPSSVYFWRAEITDQTGNVTEHSGTILLLKKH